MLMSMHCTNLSYLMSVTKVSGRDLARYLNVDNSLVSKWKNNLRPLSKNTSYLKKLSLFFLETKDGLYLPAVLELLKTYYPNQSFEKKEERVQHLSHWLTQPYERAAFIRSYTTQHGLLANQKYFSVYHGDEGRRDAVLFFLDTVLHSKVPKKLKLVSQEDMSWMVRDPLFLQEWKSKLSAILQKGHQIEIIHWVSRASNALEDIITQWMPLYFSGNLTSKFYPSYITPDIPGTLFIIEDSLMILGMEGDSPKNRYTAMFSDSFSLQHYQRIFNHALEKCPPLVEIFNVTLDVPAIFTQLSPYSLHKESISVSPFPGFQTMPIELLDEILVSSGINTTSKERCLQYYHQLKIANNGFASREIYSKESLIQALSKQEYIYSDLSLIAGETIKAGHDQVLTHLRHILNTLNDSSDYQVGLTSEKIPFTVYVDPDQYVLSWSPSQSPYLMMAKEANVLKAFFHKYTDFWNSIPTVDKDKDVLRNMLNKKIMY